MAADKAADLQTNLNSLTVKRPLYEGSTQYKSWRYSPEQLEQVRTSLNAAAVAVIRDTFEADEPGSSEDVLFLNANEEQLLVKLYITKVPQLCGHFRFPEEVEATAISYLKRFYLKNTVMDWHPKNVMLTALFLATKTTNNPISLESYTSNIPKTSSSDVLDLEFLVSQSLNFEFAVWHAHRALWGIWLDLQSLPDVPEDLRPQDIYDIAIKHVRASRFTDAELIYTPSQIALASLTLASPVLAEKWADLKAVAGAAQPLSATLDPTLELIKYIIMQMGHPPDVEAVREVDRRLKLCKNPEKVPGSKAYIARQAAEHRRAEEKRNKKAEDVRRAGTDGGNPFGSELNEDEKAKQLAELDDDDD
ncbi:cyclin-like protein [Suillus subaureus]|uniref:Cyclin-like protein n=1 Tax=Suillus subaureus TaxID=48587 RepID=A0A9P7ENU0_9AGAM|nr:cyclin-like protein [Suillus subaureus]KAG1826099.1 cyclin-like protein [Suillus subaureus]